MLNALVDQKRALEVGLKEGLTHRDMGGAGRGRGRGFSRPVGVPEIPSMHDREASRKSMEFWSNFNPNQTDDADQ